MSADSETVIRGLSEAARANEIAIRVMVELGTEIERTGAEPDQVVQLAQLVEEDDSLHFAGLLVYPSNPSIRPKLQATIEGLYEAGIGLDVVSGGGSGAALSAAEVPELTELRVGTYVYNDMNCVLQGWAALEDCAMTVLATVVSHPAPERAILDCGSKTLAADQNSSGHGYIVEYPQARIYKLNEEHAFVDLTACDQRPAIGERVHVIPVHACVVTNLHNRVFGLRGEFIEEIWNVAARGLVW